MAKYPNRPFTEPKLNYRPRLSIDLTEELSIKIRNLIPHGIRGKIFLMILEDLVKLIEEHGGMVLGAFLDREIGVKEISRLEVEDGND